MKKKKANATDSLGSRHTKSKHRRSARLQGDELEARVEWVFEAQCEGGRANCPKLKKSTWRTIPSKGGNRAP